MAHSDPNLRAAPRTRRARLIAAGDLYRLPLAGVARLALVALPGPALFRLARARGTVAWLVSGNRGWVMGQLRRCFGEKRNEAELRRIARRHFQFVEADGLASIWPGLRSFSGSNVSVAGLEHLDAVLARGNGALLLSFHLGYARLIKPVLRSKGYTAVLVGHARPDSPRDRARRSRRSGARPEKRTFSRLEQLVRWRLLRFPSLGPKGISDADIAAGINVRPVLAALARNAGVIVIADGAAASSRVPSSVLGMRLRFAPGVFSVARASGAAVLPAFVVDDGKRVGAGLRLEICPPLELAGAAPPSDGIDQFAAVLERYVERYPHMLRWTTRRFVRASPEDGDQPKPVQFAGARESSIEPHSKPTWGVALRRPGREAPHRLPHVELRKPNARRGGPAYAFELPRADVERRETAEVVRLADYLGRQPVLLTFGSYTCPRFRAGYEHIEKLARTYGERVAFFVIYVREAHPLGRFEDSKNRRVGIAIEDPSDFADRLRVACECAESLPIGLPLLVDGTDDRVTSAYGGWPSRACLITRTGIVRYRRKLDRIHDLESEIRRELRADEPRGRG